MSNIDAIKKIIDFEYENSKNIIRSDFIYLKEKYDIYNKDQFNKLTTTEKQEWSFYESKN